MARIRDINEEREKYYHAIARQDAPHWARWKFWPGAMIMMPTRVLLLCLGFITCVICISVLSIGHNFKKGPMPDGCRKRAIKAVF